MSAGEGLRGGREGDAWRGNCELWRGKKMTRQGRDLEKTYFNFQS